MYKTMAEAEELVNLLKRELYTVEGVDIVLCPPFIALSEIADMLEAGNIELGAQDMHWEAEGAYTGEVSPLMLKSAGCKYVIIGHSERRQFFAETNETVNKKVISALKNELIPIMCVGENLNEREKGITFDIIRQQLESGLKGISPEDVQK